MKFEFDENNGIIMMYDIIGKDVYYVDKTNLYKILYSYVKNRAIRKIEEIFGYSFIIEEEYDEDGIYLKFTHNTLKIKICIVRYVFDKGLKLILW